MTKLILIRGNAGSGKSSLAHLLQEHLGENTMLLSQDNIRRTMLRAKDGPQTPTIPILIKLLSGGKEHCDHIILEGILRSDWYLPLWESIAEQFVGSIYAYYYDLPFEETLSRHQTRPKAAEFGEDSLRRWWMEKDYLTQIPETLIGPDQSLQDVCQQILNDLES